ncbi:MAG: YciI family protein [Deltaproteobacteria bacterium]|nr:YciI family protein [Deltaproteobacteria bacterium]
MKFVCFGYLDVERWSKRSPSEQNAMMDRCFAYDDVLKKNGHWAGGEALQGATTIGHDGEKTYITDGPYAETKELLGGLLLLEARDLKQAIELISNHPGVQMGRWEVRPTHDLAAMVEASERRRAVAS